MKTIALTLAALTAPALAFASNPKTVDYDLSVAGISVGDVRLTIDADPAGGPYRIDATGGARFLIWKAALNVSAEGADGAPRLYDAVFGMMGREMNVRADFDEAGALGATIDPPPEGEWTENRIPIEAADMKGARDPLSALLLSVDDAAKVCAGVLPIYTGFVRFDLALSPDPKGEAEGGVACKADYRPVSGHRAKSDSVDRMRKAGLRISFFEVSPGLWAPQRLVAPSSVGSMVFERVETQATN